MKEAMDILIPVLSTVGGIFFALLLYAYIKGLLNVDEPSWSSGPVMKDGQVIDGRSISSSSIDRMHRG